MFDTRNNREILDNNHTLESLIHSLVTSLFSL